MKKAVMTLALLALFNVFVFAQEMQDSTEAPKSKTLEEKVSESQDKIDGINETILDMKSTLDALKKIKVSGYIQTQFQNVEKDAAYTSALDFRNKFTLRRGRLKIGYDNGLTQFVYQLQADESGSVTTKDLYASITEPWMKTFSYTMGLFVRPFGFETPYSSNVMEYPERAKIVTTTLPSEEDLGAMITIAPQDGFLSMFNLQLGLFTGNGIKAETDNYKDIIGRLGYKLSFEEIGLAVDGGFSGYFGNVKVDAGKKVIELDPSSYKEKLGESKAERTYFGADIQTYFSIPGVDEYLGSSSIKGELIMGKQPGTSSSSAVYAVSATPTNDVYLRNFMGFYVSFVQNIGLSNQLVVKYDVYDPNTDVKESEIGQAIAGTTVKTGKADIKYSTLGFGLVHHWDENVKFTLYYDMVKNEKASNLAGYTDDLKDNVLTFRMQYRF